jgi:hypothetical protein
MEYWNDLLTGIFKKITRKIINNIFKYLQQYNMKLLYTTKKTSVKIILTCSDLDINFMIYLLSYILEIQLYFI